MIVPVILSGGSGARLWPLSRELHPKQFLPFAGDETLLQATLRRLDGIEGLCAPIIVCHEEHRFLLAEQLRQIGIKPAAILLEPVGRNTAPATALAAATALQDRDQGEDLVLLVLPADHLIRDVAAFRAAVAQGERLAQEDKLVTFGVVPDRPDTGYGYIRAAPRNGPVPVEQFVEKPNEVLAHEYVSSGEYLWNAGMFMFRAGRYIEELRTHRPEIITQCVAAVAGAKPDVDFIRVDRAAFEACPPDSIDYAVMENTAHAWVVPLDAGWNDVGSWASLHNACEKDAAGNVVRGDVLLEGVSNSYLHSESRLLAAVGLADCIVIETKDAVLVVARDHVQDVRQVVKRLTTDRRPEAMQHREVVLSWGSHDSLEHDERFQVRRIVVHPGAQLATQLHHHRAEHWIVVQGTARVTRGDDSFLLGENSSTFIPMGVAHRLENPGKVPLHLIQVQSGSYLGEDDVVRFDETIIRRSF